MWAKNFLTSTFAPTNNGEHDQDESFRSTESNISGIIQLDDLNESSDNNWANDLTDALLDSTIMAPPQAQAAQGPLDRTFVDPDVDAGAAQIVENANCNDENNVAWVEFNALRASWTANKGWITRWTGYLEVHVTALGNNTATQLDIDKGEDYSRKLQQKSEEMINQLSRMAFLCPQVTNDCDAKSKAIFDANIASYRNFQQICTQYRAHARAQAPAQAAGGNNGPRGKPDESLRPDKLTIEHTPADMDMWIREFKTYYDSSALNLKSIDEQRGHLSKCLDDNLKKVLMRQVLPDTLIWGPNGCIETLRIEFTESTLFLQDAKHFLQCNLRRGRTSEILE